VYLCISRLIKVIIITHGGNLKPKRVYLFLLATRFPTLPTLRLHLPSVNANKLSRMKEERVKHKAKARSVIFSDKPEFNLRVFEVIQYIWVRSNEDHQSDCFMCTVKCTVQEVKTNWGYIYISSKGSGRDADPLPPSSAEVKNRVELKLYSP
jgi:hypothetical protein